MAPDNSAPPDALAERIEAFRRNSEAYRSPAYNEAETRGEFIEPFFEALGWDVRNRRNYAEAYKDVVREGSIRTTHGLKAPDYSFRIGGQRKFFVEAKKPSLRIARDQDAAYQLRRYACSAQLPVSILTNFAELAVYDGTVLPDASDPPTKARLLYFTLDDYMDRWPEIEERFSYEAVVQGAFDRYAAPTTRRRGASAVDVAFLSEIESWREWLAKDLHRNNDLAERQLNYAIQQSLEIGIRSSTADFEITT